MLAHEIYTSYRSLSEHFSCDCRALKHQRAVVHRAIGDEFVARLELTDAAHRSVQSECFDLYGRGGTPEEAVEDLVAQLNPLVPDEQALCG